MNLVADRKAALRAKVRLSGVAMTAPTDFEQGLDIWIELVDRRQEGKKKKNAEVIQVKEEKEQAELQRENLLKSLSEKRSFEEVVEAIEDTESDSPPTLRNKRRKIGTARAKGKEKAIIDELKEHDKETIGEMKGFMKEMCQMLQPNPVSNPVSSDPAVVSRLSNVENAINEVRATHQDILRFMHEMRGNFSQGWRQDTQYDDKDHEFSISPSS